MQMLPDIIASNRSDDNIRDTPSGPGLTAIIESLLFVADTPLSTGQLCEILECSPAVIEEAVRSLARDFQGRGLRLQRLGDKVQLVTAPESAPYVQRLLGLRATSKLSAAALETLAIIAYKQPITRAEIEAIRGVNSDSVLRTLVGRGLVEEVGRLESVGHPVLLGTTFEFLQYFGLNELSDLPPLEPT